MDNVMKVILVSSLLTNLAMGFIAASVYQTQKAIKQPIETLNRVTAELSTELKDFGVTEITKSFVDSTGYLHEKTDDIKEKADSLLNKYLK